MKQNKLVMSLSAAVITSLSVPGTAVAAFPEKPVTIVVPYSPGGATDSTARIMAQALQNITGQTFMVENVPGAGTVIGSSKVAKAPADGYTLLFGGLSANVLAPHIYRNTVTFDPETDFEPIGRIASQPLILVVNSESKYDGLNDLLEKARKSPGALNFGSPGNGSAPHLISELFLAEAGIEATHIPFKGAAPAISALIGGNIDFLLDTPTAPMPQVEGKRLRALGVTTQESVKGLENIPAMDGQGLEGFEANTWFALYAPKGTDAKTLDMLNGWLNDALENTNVKALMATAYLHPTPGSRQDLETFANAERKRWGQLIDAKKLEGK